MFSVDQYKVFFRHARLEEPQRYTTCFILPVDCTNTEEALAIGTATCSRGDNFDRAIGRKVALAKALKGFDRETRKAFWQAYFEKTKK
jgi:hypothetical protein